MEPRQDVRETLKPRREDVGATAGTQLAVKLKLRLSELSCDVMFD